MTPTIDDILRISSDAAFEDAALEVFRFQSAACAPYARYLEAADIDPCGVDSADEIPFLPVGVFKTHRVYCGEGEPEAVFTSSGTGSSVQSKHYVRSLADYDRVCRRGFELFYGDVSQWSIYALLPSYLEREGSSLVRMAAGLIGAARGGGFYLHDHELLMSDLAADRGRKILLGVSYALLDLAERGERLPGGTVVMETGGMKGHRPEMPKEQMHGVLKEAFRVDAVHSEYGMAELMSQAYSGGGGIFRTPPWMRVSARDPNDPFDTYREGRGAIDIIDLANLSSCAFVGTEDLGIVCADGSFSITGRAVRSEIRGCNLLIE